MSDPVATSADLGMFLGDSSIDTSRATFLIGLAQSLAESVVSPLPAGAQVVVLTSAARAYVNPENVTQELVGPTNTTFGPSGGLYLTRSEITTLRRLNGGGGAFSIRLLPVGYTLPWDTASASA